MKFKSEQVVVTRGVNERMEQNEEFSRFVKLSLDRHFAGDFGNVPDEDRVANEYALTSGDRIMSVYILDDQRLKIWIITEGDRSISTVMFPDEY
jgi:hypothetical protein